MLEVAVTPGGRFRQIFTDKGCNICIGLNREMLYLNISSSHCKIFFIINSTVWEGSGDLIFIFEMSID